MDAGDEIQSITFRLADALPQKVIEKWTEQLEQEFTLEDPRKRAVVRKRIAKYEDAGRGSCILQNPQCAEIVQGALLYFDSIRYRLLEWCIMPNHVHVLVHLPAGALLGETVGGWKSFTSKAINKSLDR